MKWQHWGVVAAMIAAVAAVWALLRKQPVVTTQNAPNTSQSGLPSYQVPLEQYQVNPPVLAPMPIVSLAAPAAPNSTGALPDSANASPTAYLTYNLGPQAALSKPGKSAAPAKAAPAGCGGCKDACTPSCVNSNQQFTDGQGNGCMAPTKAKQISALERRYPGLWAAMQQNLYEAGVDPDSVYQYWQHQETRQGKPGMGPAAPGSPNATTAGDSRTWPGAVVTGQIGHA